MLRIKTKHKNNHDTKYMECSTRMIKCDCKKENKKKNTIINKQRTKKSLK